MKKFRSYREGLNKFCYFKDGKYYSDEACEREIAYNIDIHFDWENSESFTGLTDMKGNDIYEGDVCNCIYGYTSDKIGVVYYEYGCFYVDDKHPSGNMPLKTLVKNEGNRIEVIGNIHDNPELLK